MSVDPSDEYKTLRDEMISIFQRIFLVFTAEVAANVLLTLTFLNARNDLSLKGLLALFVGLLLMVGLFLSIILYRAIYRVGSYIVVYLEDEDGWHYRMRDVFGALKEGTGFSSRLAWHEKLTEPGAIAASYAVMALSQLVMAVSVLMKLPHPLCAGGAIVQGIVFLLLAAGLFALVGTYRKSSKLWENRWLEYKNRPPRVTGASDRE